MISSCAYHKLIIKQFHVNDIRFTVFKAQKAEKPVDIEPHYSFGVSPFVLM